MNSAHRFAGRKRDCKLLEFDRAPTRLNESPIEISLCKLYSFGVSRDVRASFLKVPAKASISRGGFSLVELIVVIAVVSILASLLLPALSRAKETGRRTVCLSNLSQVSKAATMYALDNNDVYLPAQENAMQVALEPIEHKTANLLGLMGKIWTCPNRPGFPIYEPAEDQWLIGYQYFGGITNWNTPRGTLPSPTPVKLTASKPLWVLAADTTMKVDGTWGGGRDVAFADMPPHRSAKIQPDGGNQAHVDGSARWVSFENMYYIQQFKNWRGSSCQSFFYQEDLGEYGKREPIKAVNAR